jgi:hypothetical protein
MGIEPTLPAWKAGVLPLNYTRKESMVGVQRFELWTSCSQGRRATKLRYTPILLWRARRDSNSRPFDS